MLNRRSLAALEMTSKKPGGVKSALQLFFSCDSRGWRVETFEPHEALASVHGSEARNDARFVFRHATLNVAGYANVENAGAAGYDAGAVAAVLRGSKIVVEWRAVVVPKVSGTGIAKKCRSFDSLRSLRMTLL